MADRLFVPLLALALSACAGAEDGEILGPPPETAAPDSDRDGSPDDADCDADDPAVHPGAEERCNERDDNCDGHVDEGVVTTWYVDADVDGYPGTALEACEQPLGGSPTALDCDDADPDVNPDAPEVCDDGVDNDCDGEQPRCRREGRVSLDAAAAVLRGDTGDRLGSSVSRAGDLDGDGLADLWVGAYADGPTSNTWAGRVALVSGAVSGDEAIDNVVIAEIFGRVDEAQAGWAIAGGDDIDGDGVPDLALGAPGDGLSGAVFVVSGTLRGTLTLGSTGVITEGSASQDDIGAVVSTSPDLTGDGVGDVIIGSNGTGAEPGAWILAGPLPGRYTLDEAWVIEGASRGDGTGSGVAGLGDVNGDGLADLAVAADSSRLGGTDGGAVAVFYGPVARDAVITDGDRVLVAEAADDELGKACVGGRGDVDADGLDDLLLCAPSNDTFGVGAGAVYLVGGRATAAGMERVVDATARIYGDLGPARLAVGHDLGDLDADGHAEVLVGSPWVDDGGQDAGVALVFYGPMTGAWVASDADVRFVASDGEGLGAGMAAPGDTDGDGLDDLLLGAWGLYTKGRGAAYLFR